MDINLASHSIELSFFLKGLHHIDSYKYGQKNEQEKTKHTFHNVMAILTKAHELCCLGYKQHYFEVKSVTFSRQCHSIRGHVTDCKNVHNITMSTRQNADSCQNILQLLNHILPVV